MLGSLPFRKRTLIKRYYVKNKKDKIECGDWDDKEQLPEEEFTLKNRSFNKRLGENPGDVDLWLQFVDHQNFTHMKSTKLQIVDRKLDILDKALRENPSNEKLYKLYAEICDRVYPSFEVSKILDKLLLKGKIAYHACPVLLYFLFYFRSNKLYIMECTNISKSRINGSLPCSRCS